MLKTKKVVANLAKAIEGCSTEYKLSVVEAVMESATRKVESAADALLSEASYSDSSAEIQKENVKAFKYNTALVRRLDALLSEIAEGS